MRLMYYSGLIELTCTVEVVCLFLRSEKQSSIFYIDYYKSSDKRSIHPYELADCHSSLLTTRISIIEIVKIIVLN